MTTLCNQSSRTYNTTEFSSSVVTWQRRYGRRGLPWQQISDPYRIWLSEIMLQQTQVTTVMGYYTRFLQRFPQLSTLAQATLDEVMPYWAGLGYYARARNLHQCAQIVQEHYGGVFPRRSEELAKLPGIGPSTAAAIAAFAYHERSPILDGNVKRILTRCFGIYGPINQAATEKQLWGLAHAALASAPADLDMPRYTQGLMDLGATVCLRQRPLCAACPLQPRCYAYKHAAQDRLPQRQRRKPLPQRQNHMLILRRADEVLLYRRPDKGLWGGLWSLPEFDTPTSLHEHLQCWQLAHRPLQALAPIEHRFTHYSLTIYPHQLLITTPTQHPTLTKPPYAWHSYAQLAGVALPAPIEGLLSRDGLAT